VTVSNVTVSAVSLNKTATTILVGATEQLTASLAPSNAFTQSLSWSSNKTDVATVDSTGLVTAMPLGGTATITATSNGKTASCVVTVPIAYSPPEMVSIPAGSFNNGTSDVSLSAFKMSKYDITQSQYQAVMATNPSYFSTNTDAVSCPVEMVSWYDAVEFCNKLSTTEGLTPVYAISGRTPATGYPITSATVSATWTYNGYRLPTEAQWEYAARAGTTTTYFWGNASDDATVGQYAWFTSNSDSKTHAVGQKLPNSFGLYDMVGNVWQWCWDWYGSYPSGTQNDPTGASSGTGRVARGGGWASSSEGQTSAYRGYREPYYQLDHIGIRVVAP
jgi:formylglycine-generating enzyme required for sulfatase activity